MYAWPDSGTQALRQDEPGRTEPVDLFGEPLAPRSRLPQGLDYQPEFLSTADEAALIALVRGLPLAPAPYKSYTARRRVVAFDRPQPGRGLAGRTPVDVADLPGLFVAGDWVGPTGQLADASAASAVAAARRAVDHSTRRATASA